VIVDVNGLLMDCEWILVSLVYLECLVRLLAFIHIIAESCGAHSRVLSSYGHHDGQIPLAVTHYASSSHIHRLPQLVDGVRQPL
jgi:hypothetical protein